MRSSEKKGDPNKLPSYETGPSPGRNGRLVRGRKGEKKAEGKGMTKAGWTARKTESFVRCIAQKGWTRRNLKKRLKLNLLTQMGSVGGGRGRNTLCFLSRWGATEFRINCYFKK